MLRQKLTVAAVALASCSAPTLEVCWNRLLRDCPLQDYEKGYKCVVKLFSNRFFGIIRACLCVCLKMMWFNVYLSIRVQDNVSDGSNMKRHRSNSVSWCQHLPVGYVLYITAHYCTLLYITTHYCTLLHNSFRSGTCKLVVSLESGWSCRPTSLVWLKISAAFQNSASKLFHYRTPD